MSPISLKTIRPISRVDDWIITVLEKEIIQSSFGYHLVIKTDIGLYYATSYIAAQLDTENFVGDYLVENMETGEYRLSSIGIGPINNWDR